MTLERTSKGCFVGAAFALTTQVNQAALVSGLLGWIAGCLLVVLLFHARRNLFRSAGSWAPALLLAMLEHPFSVHGAVLAGLAIGAMRGGLVGWPLAGSVLAGAVLGLGMDGLLRIRRRKVRIAVSVLALGGLAGSLWFLADTGRLAFAGSSNVTALTILASTLLLYLLNFAGHAEETELDVGLLCLSLGLGLGRIDPLPPMVRGLVVLVPASLFVIYCERIRQNLVVFKHVVRGLGYEQEGNLAAALVCYRRALDVRPTSELAWKGNWRLHRKIDTQRLAEDPELVRLIDPRVCLARARELLGRQTPSSGEQEEAGQLLGIVEYRRDDLPLTLGYERARLRLAARDGAGAMALCRTLLAHDPPAILSLADHEAEALFRTWALALKDPLLVAQGGVDLIESGSGLFQFLAALGCRLRQVPQDPDALGFRPFVYEKVTFAAYEEYVRRFPDDGMEWFDYRFCRQQAEQLAAQPDAIPRAIELFRVSEMGLPQHRLAIWSRLAQLSEHTGADAVVWCQRIKELALSVGPARLEPAEQDVYYETVRLLGERAHRAGELSAALENYRLYAEAPRSGLATLRTIQEILEGLGDRLMAIRPIETALAYPLDEPARRRWLAEKDRLYAAVTVDDVRSWLGQVEGFFDFGYCYRKASRLFEQRAPHDEVMHYLDLASLGGPAQLDNVNYLLGRAHFRAGNHRDAALCLEAVRARRPRRFADAQQEENHFAACRLLGDIYLDHLGEPAKAVDAYLSYKDYVKSGAETLFRLARAYEASGQPAHARKWYDMVLVYPNHPRADAARQALARLA